MSTRRKFISTTGALGGMLITQNVFASLFKGEAPLVPRIERPAKENSYWYLGHLMSVLLTSKDTENKYAMLRATERRGLEPPPHTHTREDETFYILKGAATYHAADQVFEAKEGDVVFLPKNIQHFFKIKTETLETLIMLTPGGFENYFIEMSTPAEKLELPPFSQSPPDIKKLISVASKYGIKFPPL